LVCGPVYEYPDFLRLKDANIKTGYIEIETQKTGQTVTIPLHNQVKTLEKKEMDFLELFQTRNLTACKDLCEVAG
jgi:hypothetical protein